MTPYRCKIIGTYSQCHHIWENFVPQFYRDDNRCHRYSYENGQVIEINSDTSGAIGRYPVPPVQKGHKVPVIKASDILAEMRSRV